MSKFPMSAFCSGQPSERTLTVGFVLLSCFTMTPFSGFVDALRLAADDGDRGRPIRCRWSVIGATLAPVASSCGIEISPKETFAEPERFDYIVVVGGSLNGAPQYDHATLAYLRLAAGRGVTLVGLCTATFALIEAGVMSGRRCCVSWFYYNQIRSAYPKVELVADRVFVVDRGRITCAGGTGAIDVAASIIEKHFGRAVAQKCLHILVVDRARDLRSAQPHQVGSKHDADQRVRRAILLMEQNLAEAPSIRDLACKVGLSTRQFERLFARDVGLKPSAYARRVRLQHATFLLKTTLKSIAEVALDCGFADAPHFTRAFQGMFGTTPGRVRLDGDCAELRWEYAQYEPELLSA